VSRLANSGARLLGERELESVSNLCDSAYSTREMRRGTSERGFTDEWTMSEFTTNPLTLNTLTQISFYTTGTYKIYLEALIRYRDTFNQPHWTRVCAYHISGAPLDTFQYCEHGNEIDQSQNKRAN
jgi:hypothetical protein